MASAPAATVNINACRSNAFDIAYAQMGHRRAHKIEDQADGSPRTALVRGHRSGISNRLNPNVFPYEDAVIDRRDGADTAVLGDNKSETFRMGGAMPHHGTMSHAVMVEAERSSVSSLRILGEEERGGISFRGDFDAEPVQAQITVEPDEAIDARQGGQKADAASDFLVRIAKLFVA